MNTIIILDNKLPQKEVLVNAINVQYYYFNDIEWINCANISRVGFLWENNKSKAPFGQTNYTVTNNDESEYTLHYFSKEFIDFLSILNGSNIIDLITCSLNSPTFHNDLSFIKNLFPNMTFNYSINKTGNGNDIDSDWMMESSGENIKNIYFNDKINNFTQTLGLDILLTLGFSSTAVSNGNVTYTLGSDLTITQNESNYWVINGTSTGSTTFFPIDTSVSDANYTIDGVSKNILITTNSGQTFPGLFSGAGYLNTDTENTYTVIFNNFNIIMNGSIPSNRGTLWCPISSHYAIFNSCFAIINGTIGTGAGGLIGSNCGSGSIVNVNNCNTIVNGNLSGNSTINSSGSGGLIGANGGAGLGTLNVNNSYSIIIGNVEEKCGGLIGSLSKAIVVNVFTVIGGIVKTDANAISGFISSLSLSNLLAGSSNYNSLILNGSTVLLAKNLSTHAHTSYGDISIDGSFAHFLSSLNNAKFSNTQHFVLNNRSSDGILSLYNFPKIINNINASQMLTSYNLLVDQVTSIGCVLTPNVNLTGVNLNNLNLTNTNLSNATFNNTKTGPLIANNIVLPSNYGIITNNNNNNFIVGPNVDLTNADFNDVNFANFNLSGANLTGIMTKSTKFNNLTITTSPTLSTGYKVVTNSNGTIFIVGPNVDLTDVNLTSTNLTDVNLSGTTISRTKFINITYGNTTLPNNYSFVANVLDTIQYFIVGPNVDLTNANLSSADLTNVNLSGVDLTNANLSGVNLTGVNTTVTIFNNLTITTNPILSTGYKVVTNSNDTIFIIGPNVDLTNVDLTGADLTNVNLSGAIISGTKFINITHENTILSDNYSVVSNTLNPVQYFIVGPNVDLTNTNLIDVDLSNINLSNSTLTQTNLSNTTINKTIFNGIKYSQTPILPTNYFIVNKNSTNYIIGPNVDLTGIDLSEINLSNSDLTNSILTNVILTNSNLTKVTLTNTNLSSLITLVTFNNLLIESIYGETQLIQLNTTLSRNCTFALYKSSTNNYDGTLIDDVITSSYTIPKTNVGTYYYYYKITDSVTNSFVYSDILIHTITKKTVILSATKKYDGTTNLTGTQVTISNLIGSETLTYTGATCSNKNVLTENKYISNIVLADGTDNNGGLASNYDLPELNNTNASVTITKKIVTLRATKEYDGTLDLTGTQVTISNLIGSETLTYTGATCSNKNVLTENKYISNIVLADGTGDNAGLATNYRLPVLNNTNAPVTITKKIVTLSATKKYDGTLDLTGTQVTIGNLIGSETLTHTGATCSDKNVLVENKYIDVIILCNGTDNNGGIASNYKLPVLNNTNAPVTITKKTVTLSATKKYDSTTNLTGTQVTIGNLIGTETLTYTGATCSDKNVLAVNKYINAITLANGTDGGLASNYNLPELNNTNAPVTINKRPLTLIVNKIYDGTTKLNDTEIDIGELQNGETLLYINASCDNSHIGTPNNFVNAITLQDGTGLVSNYELPSLIYSSSNNVTIRKRELIVSDTIVSNKVYDRTTTTTPLNNGTLVGVLPGDDVYIDVVTATFINSVDLSSDANVKANKTVTLHYTLAGNDKDKYTISDGHTVASITPQILFIHNFEVEDRPYDGTTNTTITNYGTLKDINGNDMLNIETNVSIDQIWSKAYFVDKNAGTNKLVNSAFILTGTNADNYTLTQTTCTATIREKQITFGGNFTVNDKIYDATTNATIITSPTIDNKCVGDNVSLVSNIPFFLDANVGDNKLVTGNFGLVGSDSDNYYIELQLTCYANIKTNSITITGIIVAHKVYDGTRTAIVLNNGTLIENINSSDDVSIGSVVAYFDDENVGENKTVTFNYTLKGRDAHKYMINPITYTTGKITPKLLNVVGISIKNKIYDANTDAELNKPGVLVGVIPLDDVIIDTTINTPIATFIDDANVGDLKRVLVTYKLVGTKSNNYTIDDIYTVANIMPKPLTVSNFTVENKYYDATTDTIIKTATLIGIIGNDEVEIAQTTEPNAHLIDKNAGTNKPVIGAIVLSGLHASNYTLPIQPMCTATITQKALVINNFSSADKTYDGTRNAIINGTPSIALDQILGSDDVKLVVGIPTFETKNASNDVYQTVTGNFGLTGSDSNNYVILTQPTYVTAKIIQKPLKIIGTIASNKVYDNNTDAVLINNGSLIGIIEGDSVDINKISALFSDENIGLNKNVNVTYELIGDNKDNYSLPQSVITTKASITQPTGSYVLTVGNFTVNDKNYDGTTNATITDVNNLILNGVREGDNVTIDKTDSTALFFDKHCGNQKLAIGSIKIIGADAKNYSVIQPICRAKINKIDIHFDSFTPNDKNYDGTTNASIQSGSSLILSEIKGNDDVTLITPNINAFFSSKNASNQPVQVTSNFELGGLDAENYILIQQIAYAKISKKPIQIKQFYVANKIYDGTTNATITNIGVLFGVEHNDDVQIDVSNTKKPIALFSDKNVSNNKIVTGIYVLTGSDTNNYQLTQPTTQSNINKKDITIDDFSVSDKVFDGNRNTTVTRAILHLESICKNEADQYDNVALLSVDVASNAYFDTANAGNNKSVTGNFSLTGSDSLNYRIIQPSSKASIAQKLLSITGFTGNDKVYNANTVCIIKTYGSLVGLLSSDVGKIVIDQTNSSASFDNKNVGQNKVVTGSLILKIATTESTVIEVASLISNYVLTQPTTNNVITQQPVNVTDFSVNNKLYDGKTTAIVKNIGTLNGTYSSDIVKIDSTTLSVKFPSPNQGSYTLTPLEMNLIGTDALNYKITQLPTCRASIQTKKSLAGNDLQRAIFYKHN